MTKPTAAAEKPKYNFTKALKPFDLAESYKLDCGGGRWMLIRRAQESNPIFRAQVAIERRKLKGKSIAPSTEYLTGSLEGDVNLLCNVILIDWHFPDDDGVEVPVEDAGEVFRSDPGQVLFFKVMEAARTETLFKRDDDSKDADAKN